MIRPDLLTAYATTIDAAPDSYSSRGVAITRDGASLVIAALRRDAHEMRSRGGEPNLEGAAENDLLAEAIGKVLVS